MEIKPETIRIGDRDVPAGYRGEVEKGQRYYFSEINAPHKYGFKFWWGHTEDICARDNGILHLTASAAVEMTEALIALLRGVE